MPLPLGHCAIGLATHSLITAETDALKKWKLGILVVLLSNLPDIDVLFGLALHNNGSIFHRGPTHSVLFALVMGLLVHGMTKRWRFLPAIHFRIGFPLIFSHLLADFLLTDSPVSFFWPLKVSWATGNEGWRQVFHDVIFNAGDDMAILIVCIVIVIMGVPLRRALSSRHFKITSYAIWPGQILGKSSQQSSRK